MKKFFRRKKKSKESLSNVSSVTSVPLQKPALYKGDTSSKISLADSSQVNGNEYGDVPVNVRKDPSSLFIVPNDSELRNEGSPFKMETRSTDQPTSIKTIEKSLDEIPINHNSSVNLDVLLDPQKDDEVKEESSEYELPEPAFASSPYSSRLTSAANVLDFEDSESSVSNSNSPNLGKITKFPNTQDLRRTSYPTYTHVDHRMKANTSLKKRIHRSKRPNSAPLRIDFQDADLNDLEDEENSLFTEALRIAKSNARKVQEFGTLTPLSRSANLYDDNVKNDFIEPRKVVRNIKSLTEDVKLMQDYENSEPDSCNFIINRSSSRRNPGPGCCPDYDPCCDDEEKITEENQYRSGQITRYCDMLASGVQGNPTMIGDIIRDLHCVFDKTFGESQNLQCQQRSMKDEIRSLKREICELQQCLDQLNKEISRLQMELRAAQAAFEQEAARRLGLETYASQLRAKLSRAEAESEHHLKEKLQLECCLKEMQLKLKEMGDMIDCLTMERDNLQKNCKGFDDWRSRANNNITDKDNRCCQLEEALAKCCKANEELQAELAMVKKERDCLKMAAEKLQAELKRLSEEYEKAKKCWEAERKCLEKTIAELRQTIDCLTLQNKQICQRMKDVVAAHHFEMDCLKKDAEKWKKLYEDEKAAKEKLQKLLDDCEEKKLQIAKQQAKAPVRNPNPACDSTFNCEDIMNKYSFSPAGGAPFNCNPNCEGNASNNSPKKCDDGSTNSTKGAQFREKQNAKEIIQLKEKLQVADAEIKTERETLVKMRNKVNHYKEALRVAREREQDRLNANESKIKGLKVKIDQLKFEHENFVRTATIEREDLLSAIKRLEKENSDINLDYKKLELEMKANDENNNAIEEIIRRKDKLENELERLKVSIQEKYVDRASVNQWKEKYEAQINALTENYERNLQIRVHNAVVKVRADMEKELYDRNFAQKLREQTETSLRNEYSSMVSSWKSDMEKFKHLVRTRDEEISSLKSSIEHLKHKYSSESIMKDELLKKLQIVANASRTSVRSLTSSLSSMNNNKNNNSKD